MSRRTTLAFLCSEKSWTEIQCAWENSREGVESRRQYGQRGRKRRASSKGERTRRVLGQEELFYVGKSLKRKQLWKAVRDEGWFRYRLGDAKLSAGKACVASRYDPQPVFELSRRQEFQLDWFLENSFFVSLEGRALDMLVSVRAVGKMMKSFHCVPVTDLENESVSSLAYSTSTFLVGTDTGALLNFSLSESTDDLAEVRTR